MSNTESFKVAILAKSNKRRNDDSYGCCVAGLNESMEWIRFVADEQGDSLPKDIGLEVRQVISARGVRAPLTYQKENVILEDFDVTNEDYNGYIQNLKPVKEEGIFGNTKNILFDWESCKIHGTLRLINVQNLEIYWDSSMKCKAKFTYDGVAYDGVSMTDPEHYTKKGSPVKQIGNADIVVSIPEKSPFNKFVAAIYPEEE